MPRTRHWCGTASSASYRRTASAWSAPTCDGIIHAERTEYQDAGWADCERAWVINAPATARGRGGRGRSAAILRWRSPYGRLPSVPRRSRSRGSRNNRNDPWRNLPFTQPCRSTGVLERATRFLGGTPGPAGAARLALGSSAWLLSPAHYGLAQIASRRSAGRRCLGPISPCDDSDPARPGMAGSLSPLLLSRILSAFRTEPRPKLFG